MCNGSHSANLTLVSNRTPATQANSESEVSNSLPISTLLFKQSKLQNNEQFDYQTSKKATEKIQRKVLDSRHL